ncbi:aspartyl-phosphate phosphatase Spo0E family protein, partial [Heyndrickxia sporothermodurans]
IYKNSKFARKREKRPMPYDEFRLKEKIEKLRQKMIEEGLNKGLKNMDTVAYSQKLDQLIYEYQLKM